MSDQAHQLRTLVHTSDLIAARRLPASAAPRLVAIAGAKGGVGTTSIALNLAIALARDGRRTLLVDADRQRADVGAHCGIFEGPGLVDVLSGGRSLHEIIQRGPPGVQILPGHAPSGMPHVWPRTGAVRLLRDLRGLGPHTEIILLDIGASLDESSRAMWTLVNEVVLVTTCDGVSVMDAYAAIKANCIDSAPRKIALLVNRTENVAAARDVYLRLQQACRRFLRIDVHALGTIGDDAAVREASVAMRPFILHAPDCAAARQINEVAERLTAGHFDLTLSASPAPAAMPAKVVGA